MSYRTVYLTVDLAVYRPIEPIDQLICQSLPSRTNLLRLLSSLYFDGYSP
ncbi:hypothetical protein [Leptolyngbya ohadii]|nr:hypothetical protein [Leptolyngbya ohadii]